MAFVKQYLIPRLFQYFLTIFLGVTAVFFIPRLAPADPVLKTINAMRAQGGSLDPATLQSMIEDLQELYGLQGSTLQQYGSMWKRVFSLDFGVSFFQFPTPVIKLISASLPWTAVLMLSTTLFAWIIANLIGGWAGYFPRKRWSRALDNIVMVIRPVPYYIFAFILLLLFAYVVKWFPVAGGTSMGRTVEFSLPSILDILRHAFLPALSLVVIFAATWFQSMKLIVQNINAEDYVQYAELGGIKERKIVNHYVIRNALLPQITSLALSLGLIFDGAVITEIVYSYPGLGSLLYSAIRNGDYNLIMGITIISILAIATAVLVIDLLYPLFDPRIRLR